MNQLDAQIANFTGMGYHLESNTGQLVTMVKGKRPNHLLHLILSIITLGLWVPVWVGVAAFGGEKRVLVALDGDGQAVWKHVK